MTRSPSLADCSIRRDALDRVVSDAFGAPFQTLWSRTGIPGAVPQPIPLDVYATDDQVVILAAIPGMNPDDLEVSVHQNTVSLTGKVGGATEEANGATWYLRELGSGIFQRSVTLPFPIDPDQTHATFEHGMLRVVLAKAESARPRKIAINGGRQSEAIAAADAAETSK